jgi:excisionase family DNA binding protein
MEEQQKEITGYISPAEAARRLKVSDTRIYALLQKGRLATMKVADAIFVSEESVRNFKPKSVVGRPRVRSPKWHYSPQGATLCKTYMRVRMYDEDQLDVLIELLKAIGGQNEHLFHGAIARTIAEDDSSPGTIEIELTWKQNDMPTDEVYEAMLQSFKDSFAHVLNWDTAQYGTKTIFLHT